MNQIQHEQLQRSLFSVGKRSAQLMNLQDFSQIPFNSLLVSLQSKKVVLAGNFQI